MNIIRSRVGLNELDKNLLGHFVSQYNKTPNDFIKQYGADWSPDDLKGKYVVAVEPRYIKPNEKDPLSGRYNFFIQSVYTPRYDQTAELMYCGHIAFVIIKDALGKEVCKLYKDDECYPQSLDDWYEQEVEWMVEQNYNDDGQVPTKQEFIDIIEAMIKGYSQDPLLELNIKKEDVIILQGL